MRRPTLAFLATLVAGVVARDGVAGQTRVHLVDVGTDSARLAVAVDPPAAVEAAWGEQPGEWTSTASSAGVSGEHELLLASLAPDRRYFYEIRVSGEPGEVLTFRTGRSWASRQASMVITREGSDADRLFAEEVDALVVLGADPDAAARAHPRSATDRVVAGSESQPPVRASDLAFVPAAASTPTGACWVVAPAGTATADVVVATGEVSSVANGTRIVVTLGPGASARIDSASERLTVILRGPGAVELGRATTSKSCSGPSGTSTPTAAPSPDGDEDPGASSFDPDAGGTTEDCGLS